MSAIKPTSKNRKPASLKSLGEDELIHRIAQWSKQKTQAGVGERQSLRPWAHMKVEVAIGDDTAVLRPSPAAPPLALTTDMMVEGTHFFSDHPPQDLGAKALASNLSDLAAMGAWPAWILVSLGAPATLSIDWIEAFYQGIQAKSAPYGCLCLGGDTVRSEKIVVNIVAGGNCDPKATLPLRSRARPGQSLYVTGSLGDSRAGLYSLSHPEMLRQEKTSKDLDYLIARHRNPTPRVQAGLTIARLCQDAAMMDLSDGLLCDLGRMAKASACGFDLRLAALPISPALKRHSKALDLSARDLALCGGEDYELLFATSRPFDEWQEKVASAGPGRRLRLTRIGVVTEETGKLRCLGPKGQDIDLPDSSFRHF